MELEIEKNFVCFLYAYLRQIDLSLDRSRWGLWMELREYYKTQIPPLKILNYMERKAGFTNNGLEQSHSTKTFLAVVTGNKTISRTDFFYCAKLLKQFDDLLAKDEIKAYTTEAEKLRLEIALFYRDVLKNRLSRKEIRYATKVEHFNEYDSTKTIKIKNYLNGLHLP